MEWIKIRCDLPDDPAVIAVAAELGISEDEVVGKLVRLWSWADRHLIDGVAKGLNKEWVDRYLGLNNTAASLIKVGWLSEISGGMVFPKFERHMSQSAKARALANDRQARFRAKLRDETQWALQNHRPDEMREDEMMMDKPSGLSCSNKAGGGKSGFKLTAEAVETVVARWNALPEGIPKLMRMSAKRLAMLRQRMADAWWREQYMVALAKMSEIPAMRGEGTRDGWVASFEWFLRPDTVTKLVEGRYDGWGKGGTSTDPFGRHKPVFSSPELQPPPPDTEAQAEEAL